MQIPVLIEPVSANSFRASSGLPLALTAEGPTAEGALATLKQMVDAKLQNGSRMVTVDIGADANPWSRVAGMYAGNPRFDEWQALMAENRRKAQEEEGISP
ncbi:MAG TPA: hypothetical protein VE988_19040 [Gemmataceae bacterium]|nr:hypothetical protein [Gemmataceae bacterium]